jgi:hypothetical protein
MSPEAQRLLDESRKVGGPTAAQRATMKSVVMGAGLATGTAAAGTAAAKTVGAGLGVKLMVVAVVVVVGATVAWKAKEPETVKTAVVVPRAIVPAPLPEPVRVIEVPAPVVVAPEPPPHAVIKPKPVPAAEPQVAEFVAPAREPIDTSASLTLEMRAMTNAMNEIDGKRYAAALEQVDAYRARFPSGQLTTEAGVMQVLALCGLGRVEEARAAAEVLPRENPTVHRLDSSCVAAESTKK